MTLTKNELEGYYERRVQKGTACRTPKLILPRDTLQITDYFQKKEWTLSHKTWLFLYWVKQ